MRLFLWFSNIVRFCISPFSFLENWDSKIFFWIKVGEVCQKIGKTVICQDPNLVAHTNIDIEDAGPFPSLIFDERLYPKNKPAMMLYLPGKQKQNTIRKLLSLILICRREATKITAQAQRFEPRNEPCTEFLGVGRVFFTFALDEFVQSLWNRRFSHVTLKCRRPSCAFATIWHDKSEFPFQPSKLRMSENLLKMSHFSSQLF